MKVYVDISVFTEDAAIGRVSGNIDVPIVPGIGDIVNFGVSKAGHIEDGWVHSAQLKVTDRILPVDADTEIMIALSDLTASTREEAERAMIYLEKRYDLFAERWDDDGVQMKRTE